MNVINFSLSSQNDGTNLSVDCNLRNGLTDFSIKGQNGNELHCCGISKEDALLLAQYLMDNAGNIIDANEAKTGRYKRSGYGIQVRYAGNLIKTFHLTPSPGDNDSVDSFSYESLKKAYPGYGLNGYYFVVYELYDGYISQERLELIINTCLNHQEAFFITGNLSSLRPLTLADVSQKCGADASVISRATMFIRVFAENWTCTFDKQNGVSLDKPSVFDEGIKLRDRRVSRYEVLGRIQEIMQTEDDEHPFADQDITDKLKDLGYQIARRTVTKYRKQFLGIENQRRR